MRGVFKKKKCLRVIFIEVEEENGEEMREKKKGRVHKLAELRTRLTRLCGSRGAFLFLVSYFFIFFFTIL